MKNTIKWFGIIAIITVIGFSMVSCDLGDDYEMINGVWDRGDIVVTFTDSKGVFTEINSSSGWKSVPSVSVGNQKFRNLSKDGDLKWTGQELVYDTSTYVTSWESCTITVSSNGQTLQSVASTAGSTTYTKQ
jgi:hypothetical protein